MVHFLLGLLLAVLVSQIVLILDDFALVKIIAQVLYSQVDIIGTNT